jgi:oxygen-independent coproporphyrinogen-3 oxidase
LSTIYFGGGTPTLLEPKHFNQIISTIISHWSLDISRSEISVEANPGTADLAKLRALRQLGINRLSIGVQSFNDRHLKTLGRIHTAASAVKFYENARAAGFDNINLDLIFSLPGQTLAAWQSDLQMALGLAPDHLSTYNLELGEGTPLHKMVMKPATKRRGFQETETFSLRFPGQLQLPNEDTELAMYEHAIETLTAAGFKHYEISNFAKPGFECRHNLNYWRNGNYLGAGAGAHSHWQGKRWANPELIEEYISNDTRWTKDASSSEADRRETIFMGLRLLDGLTIEKFAGFELEVGELIRDGLLKRRNGHYQLTRRGLYLANLVFAKFV